MVFMRTEKPIIMRSTPSLSSFPNVAFEMVPVFARLTVSLSRPVKEDRLAPPSRLAPPGDLWCDVLAFVPAGSKHLKFLNTSAKLQKPLALSVAPRPFLHRPGNLSFTLLRWLV